MLFTSKKQRYEEAEQHCCDCHNQIVQEQQDMYNAKISKLQDTINNQKVTYEKLISKKEEDYNKQLQVINEQLNAFSLKNELDNIKKVHYMPDKSTIVLYNDGTKSIVHAETNETYDKRVGLLLAVLKHLYGTTDKQTYFKLIHMLDWKNPTL